MLFRSRDGETKRVASTSGSIILVGEDPVEIPAHMEIDAYAAGCLPEGTDKPKPDYVEPEDRQEVVTKAMTIMIKRDLPDDITKSGKINKTTLAKECGFSPTSLEYRNAWELINQEAQGD